MDTIEKLFADGGKGKNAIDSLILKLPILGIYVRKLFCQIFKYYGHTYFKWCADFGMF